MARTKRADGDEDVAERILKVAEEFFSVKEFHQTSLAEIARAAGISAPSLLYHYPSKDDLYREVIAQFYRNLEAVLDQGLASSTPYVEKFETTLLQMMRFELENRRLIALVIREFIGPDNLARSVLEAYAPRMMDKAERLLRSSFNPPLHSHAPVREVIIQIMMSHLARMSHGSMAVRIWGPEDRTLEIAQVLLSYLRAWPDVSKLMIPSGTAS